MQIVSTVVEYPDQTDIRIDMNYRQQGRLGVLRSTSTYSDCTTHDTRTDLRTANLCSLLDAFMSRCNERQIAPITFERTFHFQESLIAPITHKHDK